MGLDGNEHHLQLGQGMDHMSEDRNIDYDDPIFYKQPRDAFVIKSRPAKLHCRVSQALDIHFKCNSEVVNPTRREDHVEPETGIGYTDASVDITKDQVDHYFGEFHCSCVAITKKGAKVSSSALVTTACKYNIFSTFSLHIDIAL
jgi:lipopolysaccharide export system protein LptC